MHLSILLASLVCLGLWIVAFQVRSKHLRFELFAIDFALGAFLFSLLAALLLGSFGTDLPFNDRLMVSSKTSQALMTVGGLVFGLANTLLLGAVSLLGISGAFGIAGSAGLLLGLILGRAAFQTAALPVTLGSFLIAGILSALAARSVDLKRPPHPRGQPLGPIQLRRSTKGILVAVLGGGGVGISYMLAQRGAFDDFGLGPYAGLFLFCMGALAVNCLFSLYFFNIALEGGALRLSSYLNGWPTKHLPGIAGGVIWAAGALAVLLSRTPTPAPEGGSTLSFVPLFFIPLAMLLGLFLSREFVKSSGVSTLLMTGALLAMSAGIAAITLF